MRLLSVLFSPFYALMGIIASLGMMGLYLYTQVLGNLSLLDVWLANVPFFHALLLVCFTLLFGATFSYQVYLWKSPKVCAPSQRAKGSGISGVGTLGIFLIAQCPACASLGALFLPLSALTIIAEYTIWLNVLSIFLLLFTLHYLGAFRPLK
jgi:hypothetical protein